VTVWSSSSLSNSRSSSSESEERVPIFASACWVTGGVEEEEKSLSQIRLLRCHRPNFRVSAGGEGLGEHGVHSSLCRPRVEYIDTPGTTIGCIWDGVVSENFHGRIVGEVIFSQSELGNDIRVLLAFAIDFWNSKSSSQFSDEAGNRISSDKTRQRELDASAACR
jgi:hypothetical protein